MSFTTTATRQHRRARVQEMIDLGVYISPDTWPPTREQYDEEDRFRERMFKKGWEEVK